MAEHKATTVADRLSTFRHILEQERRRGCDNRAVMGGLDRFLRVWREELEAKAQKGLLQGLEALGLFKSDYGSLTPAQRTQWVEQVLTRLEEIAHNTSKDGSPDALPPPLATPHLGSAAARGAATPGASAVSLEKRTAPPPGVSLDSLIHILPGVGPFIAQSFQQAGVTRVRDLLYFLPRRHVSIVSIADLTQGEEQGIVGNLWEVRQVRLGERRVEATEAIVGDETGNVRVLWFNQPFVARALRTNDRAFISGHLNFYGSQRTLYAQSYEVLEDSDELFLPGRLVPVYPSVRRAAGGREGPGHRKYPNYISPRTVRRILRRALGIWLPRLEDFLPTAVRESQHLSRLAEALLGYHFPENEGAWQAARLRLAFDELFLTQVGLLSRKREWQQVGEGLALRVNREVVNAFLGSLPFALTGAQERALAEVLADLAHPRPMARMLQGEVGSGKTVVALAAMLATAADGYQAALMAPTEILAEQHFLTVGRLLQGLARPVQEEHLLGVYLEPCPRPLMVGLLLGSLRKREKEEMQRRIAEGQVDIIIGTHALIEGGVEIPRLALAVVDEQHRFGVMQRGALRQKGLRPHLLAMSATPIPRTLALTLYGDLDLSVIDQMPAGRKPVRTRWLRPDQREAAWQFIRQQVAGGRQAFVICPLIQESEALQTRAASEEFQSLSQEVFPDLRVALLHGRMPLKEKTAAMARMRSGEIDILVSTPVVEVGVDIPNATVMLIEGADRFGLAELHQFRGRVGRGQHTSYCMLLADDPSPEAQARMSILERESDGFKVAEEDLRLRGPGEVFGTRQSGLPDLKVARPGDAALLALARQEASRLLDEDPELAKPEHRLLAAAARPFLTSLAARTELN